jgi:hypothetical protein
VVLWVLVDGDEVEGASARIPDRGTDASRALPFRVSHFNPEVK